VLLNHVVWKPFSIQTRAEVYFACAYLARLDSTSRQVPCCFCEFRRFRISPCYLYDATWRHNFRCLIFNTVRRTLITRSIVCVAVLQLSITVFNSN